MLKARGLILIQPMLKIGLKINITNRFELCKIIYNLA